MNLSFRNFLLLLLFLSVCQVQYVYAQSKMAERSITSTHLKKNIKLLISLPEGYTASSTSYPVLYVLHSYNKAMQEIVDLLKKGNKEFSPMIVVGIEEGDGNLNRLADNARYDAFLACIEKEIFPAVEKQYRANGQRIAYGQSLSGSFTLYAFLTKPTLFDGYIAASKQWYEKNNLFFTSLADTKLKSPESFAGKKIFLASLNGAYSNSNIPEVNKQMKAFASLLQTKSGNKVSAHYQAFDDWGLSPLPGFKEGLQFVSKAESHNTTPTSPLTMTQTSTGKWVITDLKKTTLYDVFNYDNGPDYASEGLIRVVKNGKIGYADAKTYRLVIAPQFDCAYPFEKGKAKVSTHCTTIRKDEHSTWQSDHWQFIDKSGKLSK
ncbi:MAG: alpha/beta hydrolase-fold protein [Spirosomataceae bacterium]